MTFGVDYSRGGFVSPATLFANDRPVVFRYATSDLSPGGRGITPAEYAGFMEAGIEVGLYWEAGEAWMTGGYDAGARAAEDFSACLKRLGAPDAMPGFFAHDIEPQREHLSAIDACLNGIKSVLGSWERTGTYGGWGLIDYLAGGGNVTHLALTSAWKWDLNGIFQGIHPAACLYQYGYNAWFDGVNCDLVETLKDDFGQASRYLTPIVPPKPVKTYPAPEFPAWWERVKGRAVPSRAKDAAGNDWFPQRFRATATDDIVPHVTGDIHSAASGPHIPAGTKIDVLWAYEDKQDDNRMIFVNDQGSWPASGLTPAIELPHGRPAKKAA